MILFPENTKTEPMIKRVKIDPKKNNILSFYLIFKYSNKAYCDFLTHAKLVIVSGS